AWLKKREAINHLPHTPAFKEFYAEETIEGDPPKGNFTSIAKCGFSGKLLGPPNHHSYQIAIAKLHKQRFSDMPLDRYKSRINIEHDEELVERWKAEQSVQRHYTYLKAAEGEEAPKFDSRDKAEQHFIDKHGEEFVAAADEVAVRGDIGGRQLSPGLFTLLKQTSENTRKHPATLVQPLCGLLGSAGLKFFKRGRKIFA
ncbi:MAG: hypothetical protein GY953_34740, partial [bacterium]|nr:hypothetical protein [bacterium]